MFKLLMKIPKAVHVAVSGGPDSMAVLDFLRNGHKVTVVHFNHGTEHGKEAAQFVRNYVRKHDLLAHFGHTDLYGPIDFKGHSKEEVWRNRRYRFFNEVTNGEDALVLGHNLDDAVETWLFSSAHGNPKIIPPTRDNIIRPFLLVKKADLRDWCVRKNVPFMDDPSNEDVSYPRVRLRNVVIPEMLKINPGIHKVIAKKYIDSAGVTGKLKFWLEWVSSYDHVRLTSRGDGKADLWLYKDFDCMIDDAPPSMRPQLIDTTNYHPDLQSLMNKFWCGDDFLQAIQEKLGQKGKR